MKDMTVWSIIRVAGCENQWGWNKTSKHPAINVACCTMLFDALRPTQRSFQELTNRELSKTDLSINVSNEDVFNLNASIPVWPDLIANHKTSRERSGNKGAFETGCGSIEVCFHMNLWRCLDPETKVPHKCTVACATATKLWSDMCINWFYGSWRPSFSLYGRTGGWCG